MHSEPYAFKPVSSVMRKSSDTNGVGVPIPGKKKVRHQSACEPYCSTDSFNNEEENDVVNRSPVTAFSRSLSASHGGHSFNVYSMSPRSTSFMYQYYSTPKGFYQNQIPLSTSKSNGFHCRDEHASSRLRYRNLNRTISECCDVPTSPQPKANGLPQTQYNDVVQDPRRRAYSESDSNRRNAMNMSRMSALKKWRKKLGRSGSFKKRRDESCSSAGSHSHSVASITSLEKVEEGRQLRMSVSSTTSSKRNTLTDEISEFNGLSLHEEDETIKPNEFPSEQLNSTHERTRTPSNESVFNHDTELIYQRFLEEHTCYDIMPTSCKLVVFDTRLQARKAFHALIANSVRAAPLWDSEICCYVGMLTVTDFIRVILKTHKINGLVESVEEQEIHSWRTLLNQQSSFSSVRPNDTLLHSLNTLFHEHFHGVPIMDNQTGDIFHIIDHKRILRFLYLFMNELPKPSFMNKTLSEVKIGRFDDVPTITKQHTILDALELLIEKKFGAIPVVDDQGDVVDVFCKLDMISLAAQGIYHDLSMTMEIALAYRFTPLFEDDDAIETSSDRSSPTPVHRNPGRTGQSKDYAPTPISAHLNEHSKRTEVMGRGHAQSSAIRGHAVIRPKSDKPAPPSTNETLTLPLPLTNSGGQGDDASDDTPHQRVRHISLSNPLVKCRLSDKLQHVIDLMVTTDANLLVVIGQADNHVIGVVTISDVLNYIITPPGHGGTLQTSPVRVHRRSRHHLSSLSSPTTSLPSVQDEPESPLLDDVIGGWPENHGLERRHPSKHSSSSETSSANDSGYSSASKLLNPGSSAEEGKMNDNYNSNMHVLRRGAEIERA